MSDSSGNFTGLVAFVLSIIFFSFIFFGVGEGTPKEIEDLPENELFLVKIIDTNNTEEEGGVYILIVPYDRKVTTPQFYEIPQKYIHSNITVGMRIIKINGVIQEI